MTTWNESRVVSIYFYNCNILLLQLEIVNFDLRSEYWFRDRETGEERKSFQTSTFSSQNMFKFKNLFRDYLEENENYLPGLLLN